MNLKREVDLGAGLYNKLKEKGYVIDDPLLSRYLQDIGESLLSALDVRLREYHFYLVRDGSINAFATPGGYIGVHVGLIAATSTEDELASVLAHEIAHVELMHSMQMMEKASSINMASLISILAGILVSGQDVDAASALIYGGVAGSAQAMINFTRENEYEADRVGVELLKKSDYDSAAMADFMRILQKREQGGELSGIEYLRTHPVNSNRIAEIVSRTVNSNKKWPKKTRYQQFRDYLFYLYPERVEISNPGRFSMALEKTRNGRYEEAAELYRELVSMDPDSLWFSYAQAENFEYLKRYGDAREVYRSSLLLYPDELALGVRLANVYLLQELLQDALKTVLPLVQKNVANPKVYRLLVDVYTGLGEVSLRQLAEGNYQWYSGNKEQARKLFKSLISSGLLDASEEAKVNQKLAEKITKK